MHSPVVTVEADQTLAEAYRLMRENDIRHLPVMRAGRLAGIVSDRDLRFATSALHPTPFSDDALIEGVMMREPHTAAPDDPVEEAAREMHRLRIGCLPVLDEGTLVGMVTVTDLLAALLRLTGADTQSARLALTFDEESIPIADVARIAAEQDFELRSVLSYPSDERHTEVILRVDTPAVRPLANALRREGYTVHGSREQTVPT